jgi:hypothetical protein
MAVNRPRIEVEIGELTLTGVRPADRCRIVRAFTGELHRLLREHGVPVSADRAAVTGLPPLPCGGSPSRLGRELARIVHEGLAR